jgi:hypothetical protein
VFVKPIAARAYMSLVSRGELENSQFVSQDSYPEEVSAN